MRESAKNVTQNAKLVQVLKKTVAQAVMMGLSKHQEVQNALFVIINVILVQIRVLVILVMPQTFVN